MPGAHDKGCRLARLSRGDLPAFNGVLQTRAHHRLIVENTELVVTELVAADGVLPNPPRCLLPTRSSRTCCVPMMGETRARSAWTVPVLP